MLMDLVHSPVKFYRDRIATSCLSMAMADLAAKRHRAWLLHLGITFHGAIAVMMGLVSFSLAMTAALILYLRDPVDTFRDWRRTSAAQAVSRLAVRASKFVHGNVICRLSPQDIGGDGNP